MPHELLAGWLAMALKLLLMEGSLIQTMLFCPPSPQSTLRSWLRCSSGWGWTTGREFFLKGYTTSNRRESSAMSRPFVLGTSLSVVQAGTRTHVNNGFKSKYAS